MRGRLLVLRHAGETRGEASHEVQADEEGGEEASLLGESELELSHEAQRNKSGLKV
jgi:hypothetical protein